MVRVILILVLLANLAQGVCHNATIRDGYTSAICTDHITGLDFEYYDVENRHPLANGTGTATSEMLNNIFTEYQNGFDRLDSVSTHTQSTPIDKRRLPGVWEACEVWTEGICVEEIHTLTWKGSGEYFKQRLSWMINQVRASRRLSKEPKRICVKWVNGGQMCLSWARRQNGDLEPDRKQNFLQPTVDAIASNCWHYCQRVGYSCRARFQLHKTQYYPNLFCIDDGRKECKLDYGPTQCRKIKGTPWRQNRRKRKGSDDSHQPPPGKRIQRLPPSDRPHTIPLLAMA